MVYVLFFVSYLISVIIYDLSLCVLCLSFGCLTSQATLGFQTVLLSTLQADENWDKITDSANIIENQKKVRRLRFYRLLWHVWIFFLTVSFLKFKVCIEAGACESSQFTLNTVAQQREQEQW